MSIKIGFAMSDECQTETDVTADLCGTSSEVRKCLAEIYFPARGFACTYYNDSFDLKTGDFVYVDGKLEGLKGRVININYNFKIKISDYKRVIALVDTDVKGKLYFAGSHMITCDRAALPFSKVQTWFMPPESNEEEFVSGIGDTSFNLENLSAMNICKDGAEKGYDYYNDNRVVYLEVDRNKGKAIVSGRRFYTVEFEYYGGEIRNITCDCYCCGTCKHEFAAMLQLKEILAVIEENKEITDNGNEYFSAVRQIDFLENALVNKNTGSLIFE